MKIRPVILCGGAGSRLWPESKYNTPKQFIDFGGWCLLEKTLNRIKSPIFDDPIISTNSKYLRLVKKYLKMNKINKYQIVLEPSKKNTAPAILSAALIDTIDQKQSLMYFSADHLIDKFSILKKNILKNKKKLNSENIFIFGIKPKYPSSQYGYFKTNLNGKVNKFIEKPKIKTAKKIMKQNSFWNSGMFFLKKESLINNFKKYQPNIYKNCLSSVKKSRRIKNLHYLNKRYFSKNKNKSFDVAILEKTKKIYGIKLNIPWSDLGSWQQISQMYDAKKKKYYKKKNIFLKPWGKYINLFVGKGFLVKEMFIKSNSSLSLQKHFYRSEHWLITKGKAEITINKKKFTKVKNQYILIPKKSIHRVKNKFKETLRIIEIQLGKILKESDIVRYEDIYGRIK